MTRSPTKRLRAPSWWPGWRGELLMASLAAGFVVLAFPAVIFGGRTFSSSWGAPNVNGINPPPAGVHVAEHDPRLDRGASAWQFEPWAEATSRSWREEEVPLWNPFQGMGAPLAANFQSATFDPLLAAVNLHPTPLTWDLSFLLAFALGAATMYLFLRQRQLGRAASFVGTAPFILSGFFFLYSNNGFFRSYLYLPILFLLADRVARSTSRGTPVALGLAVAGNLLVGMPEASICVLGALALYAAYIIAVAPGPLSRRSVLTRFSGAALLGAAFAAPLLLPGLEYLSLGATTHTHDAKVGLAADPPGLLLNFFVPELLDTGRNWIGVASLFTGVGALVTRRVSSRWDGPFFLVLGAGILAKVYGVSLLQWTGRLPIVSQTNIPVFALPVVPFCAAVLVGTGYQALVDGRVVRRRFALLGGFAATLLLTLLYANRKALHALPAGALAQPLLLAALVAGVVAYAFLGGRRHGRLLVAVAIVGELLVLAPRDFGSTRVDPYVRSRWVQYVVDHLSKSKERVYATEAKLFPDTAAAYGLLDIRSIDALYPKRFVNYIRHFVQPGFVDRFVGGPYGQTHEQTAAAIEENPMFDLTGVRYVITGGTVPGDASDTFFRDNAATALVHPAAFDIGGDRRPVVFVHSGAKATFPVPLNARRLAFSFALAPEAFDDLATDGVDVLVVPTGGGPEAALWSTSLVPRVAPRSPEWRDARIELPPGLRSVDLLVSQRANGRTDWFGVAGVRFTTSDAVPQPQYRLVTTSDGAHVYENQHRLPRALVVHEITSVRDEAAAYRFLESASRRRPSGSFAIERFDPGRQAVVEKLPQRDQTAIQGCRVSGSASIRSYGMAEVVLDVTSECPGLLVLTDIYYPGWQATVNGRRAKIHPTDGAFRGVVVSAGRSTVEFRYRPRNFRVGLLLAGTAAIAAFTFVVGLDRRRPGARRRRAAGQTV